MQTTFDFGPGDDLRWIRDRLDPVLGDVRLLPPLSPVSQLVKSMISGRTKDAVSQSAFNRLAASYADWRKAAAAPATDIEAIISDVEYAEPKANHVHETLNLIAADHPDFDLNFLGATSVDEAIAWLRRLPGVGGKVAASTLNFSTLARPAFVVDSHILRVARRFGLVRPKATPEAVYGTVMGALPKASAETFSWLHVLLKRLGQEFCPANAPLRCRDCPLAARCSRINVD